MTVLTLCQQLGATVHAEPQATLLSLSLSTLSRAAYSNMLSMRLYTGDSNTHATSDACPPFATHYIRVDRE